MIICYATWPCGCDVSCCCLHSKWPQRQNATPGVMLLQQPLQCLQEPGTHSEESGRSPLEMGEGTRILKGLIEELSAIKWVFYQHSINNYLIDVCSCAYAYSFLCTMYPYSQYIMNCKRELDGARKQRNAWLKSQKGRKGRWQRVHDSPYETAISHYYSIQSLLFAITVVCVVTH